MSVESRLNAHEKAGLGIFLVIAVMTLVFGILRFQQSLVKPFGQLSQYNFKTSDEIASEQIEKLKTLDTDKDSLTDYDELYVYRTSPYMEDTDSDSLADGVELKQGDDPNCPRGSNCRPVKTNDSSGGTQAVAALPGDEGGSSPVSDLSRKLEQEAIAQGATPDQASIFVAVVETFGDLRTLTTADIQKKVDQLPSEQLRSFLLRIGIPSQALSKTDDATLRTLLKETLNEMSTSFAKPAVTAGPGQ